MWIIVSRQVYSLAKLLSVVWLMMVSGRMPGVSLPVAGLCCRGTHLWKESTVTMHTLLHTDVDIFQDRPVY